MYTESDFPKLLDFTESLELPGQVHSSELHVYQPSRTGSVDSGGDPNDSVPLICWLTGAGVYHGEIAYGAQDPGDSVILTTQLIPYNTLDKSVNALSTLDLTTHNEPPGNSAVPLSLASTRYHFVLLYMDRIQVVCRLDNRLVHEEMLDLVC